MWWEAAAEAQARLFSPLHQPCRGEVQRAASSGTVKQLENTWHSTGNAPCVDLPCSASSSVPRGVCWAVGQGCSEPVEHVWQWQGLEPALGDKTNSLSLLPSPF